MKLLCATPLLVLALCFPAAARPEGVDRVVLDQGLLRLAGAGDKEHHKSDEKRTEGEAGQASSDDSGAHGETRHEGAPDPYDQDVPWARLTPVRAACLTLVVLAWISWIFMYSPMMNNYASLDDEWGSDGVRVAVWAGMFLYWVAMPVTVLLSSLRFTTCSRGVPNLVYGVYGAFLTLQLAIAGYAMAASNLVLPPCFQLNGLMKSGSVLAALTVIENFDMGTDVMFPASVAACTDEITPQWMASWEQAWVPRLMLPVLENMQFDGFALTLFVTGAYIPQLLQLPSFIAPVSLLLSFTSVALWVSVHWAVGLGAAVMAMAGTVALARQLNIVCSMDIHRPANLLYNSGILIFEDQVSYAAFASEGRGPLIAATKLVCENLLQLWVQAAFLGLSFESLDSVARVKTLASICLGLAVSAIKLLPMMMLIISGILKEGLSGFDRFVAFFVLVLLMALSFMAWTVAKITFVFKCPSHIWNVTSGCVAV